MTFQARLLNKQRPHGPQEPCSANRPFRTDLGFTFGETLEGTRLPRVGGVRGTPRLEADHVGLQFGLFMPKPMHLMDHVRSIDRYQPLR